MGEVGAVHSQCVILGDFILGTLDRIREDLVVDGLLHGTYRELGVDVGRRQVIEHLITLFYRNRVMKNLEEQGVVVKEESGDKGKGRKRRSNVSNDRDLLAKSRRVDPVSKYSKNSSQASVTKLPPITTICTQSKNTQNASGIKDLQSDFPESADVEEEEENKDGGKSSQEEEDDEETDENDIFDDDGNDEEIEEGNRKTAPDIFDSSPRIPTINSSTKFRTAFNPANSAGKSAEEQKNDMLRVEALLFEENFELRKEVMKLKNKVESQARKERASKRKVVVSRECQRIVKEVYKNLNQNSPCFTGFILDGGKNSRFTSNGNQTATYRLVDEVKAVCGSDKFSRQEVVEACRTYHKSLKDQVTRVHNGTDDMHRQKTVRARILRKKCQRRMTAVDYMTEWTEDTKDGIRDLLTPAYMSSEEECESAEAEQGARQRQIRQIAWRSELLNSMMTDLEERYWRDCATTNERQSSRIQVKRNMEAVSEREKPPNAPLWAIRDEEHDENKQFLT